MASIDEKSGTITLGTTQFDLVGEYMLQVFAEAAGDDGTLNRRETAKFTLVVEDGCDVYSSFLQPQRFPPFIYEVNSKATVIDLEGTFGLDIRECN